MIAAVLCGLGLVYFSEGFNTPRQVLIFIVVVMVIYPVMINIKFEEVFSHFKEPRPVFCSLGVNFLLSPFIALLLGKIFLGERAELFAAFILISLIPTSAMSVAWTAFSGARMSTALYLVPINIAVSAFIGLPFIFPLFVGKVVSVSTVSMIKNILMVFLVPAILGGFTRRWIVKLKDEEYFQKKVKPNLGAVSATGILVLIFLVMCLKRNILLLNHPALVFVIAVPVILYYAAIYAITISWAKLLIRRKVMPGEKAVVIIYTSVARHINISMAIVLSAFSLEKSSTMVLLLIIAYIVQVSSLAVFAQRFGPGLAAQS